MNTDVTVVRIYCSEKDHVRRELLELLHDREQIAGVTAYRGIAGFGGSGKIHESSLLDMSLDLPVIIEFFDRPEKIQAVMQDIKSRVKPGHMLSWQAKANLD